MAALEELLAGQGLEARLPSRPYRVTAGSSWKRIAASTLRELPRTRRSRSHISDSLSVVPYLREPYVDIGSGAGFPAIPIGIVTGIRLTLIEPTLKKARLLESLLKTLGLRGAVLAERAEAAGHRPDLREHFASGTCRAVATAPAVAELLLPLIRDRRSGGSSARQDR